MINRRRAFAGWLAGWLVLMAGCSRAPEIPAYQLTGQILVVKHETNEVLVKHQDIPGFMPAMTMPYAVKDPAIIKDRVAGDLITATLKVAPEGAFCRRSPRPDRRRCPAHAPPFSGDERSHPAARRFGSRCAVDRSGPDYFACRSGRSMRLSPLSTRAARCHSSAHSSIAGLRKSRKSPPPIPPCRARCACSRSASIEIRSRRDAPGTRRRQADRPSGARHCG